MRVLEQLLSRARARARSTTGWMPGAVQPRPARVSIRLDEQGGPPGLPGSDGPPLDQAAWQKRLISVVEWLGPCEVRFLGGEPLDYEGLAELVRFAHRLECSTSLVTTGRGLDLAKAQELIDRGLAQLVVWVGSSHAGEGPALTGEAVDEAFSALEAALEARVERGTDLEVVAWVPRSSVPDELGQRLDRLGVGARAVGGWVDAGGEPHGDRTGSCPVASRRMELRADGSLLSCPFKAAIGSTADLELRDLWRSGTAHFEAIAGCDAGCSHPELVSRH